MEYKISRRMIFKSGLGASAAVAALALIGNKTSVAADLPALNPKDPMAVTLGYVDDSAKVDRTANPLFRIDQKCANCEQFQGNRNDSRGGCVLFAGKSVPAAAWCKVWRRMF